MLCLNLVTPLRVVVLLSILADIIYTVMHYQDLTPRAIILILFHFVIAGALLAECQRSVEYHKFLEQFEKQQKAPVPDQPANGTSNPST